MAPDGWSPTLRAWRYGVEEIAPLEGGHALESGH
jgi:hypothetical protein